MTRSASGAARAVSLVVLLAASLVRADPGAAPTLSAFASAGYLGSPGADGAVLNSGVRLGLVGHLALSGDFGYGMIGASGRVDPSHQVQDRWWLMPAVAITMPVGRVRFDLGAGLGLATASGYPSWSAFAAAPFMPVWHFQLVPAARVHAMGALPWSSRVELFVRVDAGSLLLDGSSIGIRSGNDHPTALDTTWLSLTFGGRYRFL